MIHAAGGQHLVLAPPGCGKTAVLAERIMYAHSQGVPFQDMVCLTFTNRASRGMKERILERADDQPALHPNQPTNTPTDTQSDLLPGDSIDSLFIGNVHRFCSQLLFDQKLLAENTAIIDTDVSMSIIADFMGEDELKILADTKQRQRYSQVINLQHLMYQCRKHYPGQLMVHRDALSGAALRELCLAFQLPYTQDSAIQVYEQIDDYITTSAFISAEALNTLKALYGARHYELYKQANDLVDFEDLLLFTYEALDPRHASAARQSKRWVQVDEVQDLNPLQLAIIDRIAAPDATIVYLGDAQQAIFSFMGAQLNTLDFLRQRCGKERLYNFFVNYRSPRYLLDLYNHYAERQLGIAPELLPQTQHDDAPPADALQLIDSFTNIDEANDVARLVDNLYHSHPEETIAVVVAFNTDADEVSKALRLPHFKISGTDAFSTPEMHLLVAHFNVIVQENNFIAWSRIFTSLKLFTTHSAARNFTRDLLGSGISPTDFLLYDGTTYLQQFMTDYEQRDFIIFDTETTGLNVFEDDVVQIAAIKVRQGRVVDELNLFIHTDRPIPPMLGDTPNPLVEEYARQPHLAPAEAFRRFVSFATAGEQLGVLLGHNATFDYQIMRHNMMRRCPEFDMCSLWPAYYDSLKLIRLVAPRLKSYKLRDLLATLHLEGQNSHLANDDIMATLSLVNHCWQQACLLAPAQAAILRKRRQVAQRFRNLYAELYLHSRQLLFELDNPASDLATEMQYVYRELLHHHRLAEIPKIQYILNYIATEFASPQQTAPCPLASQLEAHLQELNTLKEADLCGSKSMQERIFVSTVHKAKGLEFDNVIVYDAVDGKFPSYYAKSSNAKEEEARKFYVAISRAKRRLFVALSRQQVSPWGRFFDRQPSPFLKSIRHFLKG